MSDVEHADCPAQYFTRYPTRQQLRALDPSAPCPTSFFQFLALSFLVLGSSNRVSDILRWFAFVTSSPQMSIFLSHGS